MEAASYPATSKVQRDGRLAILLGGKMELWISIVAGVGAQGAEVTLHWRWEHEGRHDRDRLGPRGWLGGHAEGHTAGNVRESRPWWDQVGPHYEDECTSQGHSNVKVVLLNANLNLVTSLL